MQSRIQKLEIEQRIAPFNHAGFKGELYQLDEAVLDSLSVLESIRQQYAEQILHFPVAAITAQAGDYHLLESFEPQSIKAGMVILTAGAGNENLLLKLGLELPVMQRRPLQMPMLKASQSRLPLIYAHCLGASALPKMTITSYQLGDEVIWYLGGNIAEKGVVRSQSQQIEAAKRELRSLMPWQDFSHTLWSTLNIDRAEPKMPDGSRPAEPFVSLNGKIVTAWPVKLAMTPLMVDSILAKVKQLGLRAKKHKPGHKRCSVPLKRAETSLFPWEKIQQWKT
jgi:CheY-like chemotaxis protein